MKKHFLLLLWLTLLPLVGWASNIEVKPANFSVVYGDSNFPEAGSTATVEMISYNGDLPEGVTANQVAALFKFVPIGTYGGANEAGYSYSLQWIGTGADKNKIKVGETTHTVTITGGNGTLYVTKRPVTIAAVEKSKVYGASDPEFTATVSGLVDGETLNYSVSRVSTNENAGEYIDDLVVAVVEDEVSANYEITKTPAKFTITAKPIAATDLIINGISTEEGAYVYKRAVWEPVTSVVAEGNELRTEDYTLSYTDNTNAGEATVTVELATGGNYAYDGSEKATANFTIAKKDINDEDITIDNVSDKEYKGAKWVVSPGMKHAETAMELNTDFNRKNTGNNITVAEGGEVTFEGIGNYTGTRILTFNINKKEVTGTVKNQSTAFGGTLPENEIEGVSGLIAGDDFDAVVTNLAFTYEKDDAVVETPAAAGEYTIKATAEAANYTFNFTAGTLTIVQADAYIIPVAQEKFYGQKDPELTWTVADASGNALENSVLTGTVELARTAGNAVGSYTIYVKAYTAGASDNYSVKNVLNNAESTDAANKTATFTIKADATATLILKFKEETVATKVYGEATPSYGADDLVAVDGLLGTDTWESLQSAASISFELSSEDVDDDNKVTATVTGLSNYANVVVTPLPFKVTPKHIYISVKDQIIEYGKALSQGTQSSLWTSTLPTGTTKTDLGLTLYTEEDLSTYGPSAEPYEGVIKASITNKNFVIDPEVSGNRYGNLTVTLPATIALDRNNESLVDQLKALDGQTLTTLTIKNWGKSSTLLPEEEWQPMVLPFDIKVAELSKAFGYALVNVLNVESDSEDFYFQLNMREIKANQPFLIKTVAADVSEVKFEGVTIAYDPENAAEDDLVQFNENGDSYVADKHGNKFVGLYNNKSGFGATEYYYYYTAAANEKWRNNNSSATMKPLAAYMETPTETGDAPVFYIEDVNGNTTAIRTITNAAVSAEGWYTLGGVKLNAAPSEKGIYIKDGKKVVVK